VSDLT